MERDYNRQSFTPEEVEKGLHLDLLNYLLDHNKTSAYLFRVSRDNRFQYSRSL